MERVIIMNDTKYGGYTPSPDIIKDHLGITEAFVWGIVWRYCQNSNMSCVVTPVTLASKASVSERTIRRCLKDLVAAGYIIDMTPDIRNSPHQIAVKRDVIDKINFPEKHLFSIAQDDDISGPGYVYLIGSSKENGKHKIGLSINPIERLKYIRIEAPDAEIWHLIRCDDMLKAERILHQEYFSYRVQGEWFDLNDDAIFTIKNYVRFEDGRFWGINQ